MAKKTTIKKIKPETTRANVLKIVPPKPMSDKATAGTLGNKDELVDGLSEYGISFLMLRWAKLEDAITRLEYFAEVVGREMLTRQTNLAAFNITLKKIYPDI